MKEKITIVFISNSKSLYELIYSQINKKFNVEFISIQNQNEYINTIKERNIDIIILDYDNQCFNDIKSLEIIKKQNIDTPFIVISDSIGEEKVTSLFKNGINNYLLKSNLTRIDSVIKEELLNKENRKNKKNKYEQLLFDEKRLENILKIYEIEKNDLDSILDFALEESIRITGSKFGYIYDYDKNREELSVKRWSKNTIEICNIPKVEKYINLKNAGIWAYSIRKKEAVIFNSLENKNYPQGHIEIKRFLSIPIIVNEEIIGLIGVANKESDYTDDDVKQLTFFINYIYQVINRKNIEKKLTDNEKYYQTIVEDMPALVCRFLPDGTLTFVNQVYCEYFEKTEEELIGNSFTPLIPDEDKDYVIKQFSSLSYDKPTISYNHRVILKNGRIRWMNWIDHAIFDENKNIVEYQSIGRDITDEIENKKRLEELLEEKEILLKEVHHRVKNNLQVIASLIELNKPYIKDNVMDILDDIKERIRSMALIYESIYTLGNFTKIDLSQYLSTFIDRWINIHRNLNKEIELDTIFITLDIAMPLALIINELISNVIKYAFKGIEDPILIIKLKKVEDNRYFLMVKDNGVGIPDNIDIKSSNSFGFMLLDLLIKQINGEISIKKDKGTEIIIYFSDNLYKRRNLLTK